MWSWVADRAGRHQAHLLGPGERPLDGHLGPPLVGRAPGRVGVHPPLDVDTGETLLKFKTPYYLVTKFLGRMGEQNVRHMFLHPKSFKKNVDEEFYPLIDRLTEVIAEADFLAMGDTDRVAFVREVIAELR